MAVVDHDRITAIRVKGLRSLADVELTLSDLTVLIGANGAGKSSLVEVCELLFKAGTEPTFLDKFAGIHGGGRTLVRRGQTELVIEAQIDGPGGPLRYRLAFAYQDPYLQLSSEALWRWRDEDERFRPVMRRDDRDYRFHSGDADLVHVRPRKIAADELVLHARVESDQPVGSDLERVRRALAAIEVHAALDVRPRWVSPNESGARSANVVQGVRRLALGGKNLSNALVQLRGQRNFSRIVEDIRLGLGDDIEDLVLRPLPGGGEISVELRLRAGWDLPLAVLSDGQVAYLAQVAIAHLERPTRPSLVVLDEPDAHFHPGLTVRLAQMIEGASAQCPFLVATQSDAFLDALSQPADATVLCALDEHRATQLSRLDPMALARWLDEYDGLGALRRSGYDQLVFRNTASRAADGT